jgi:hypothetical protein
MSPIIIILSAVSLAILVLGLVAWRLTSSRSVIFNTLLCSAGMLFAAYFAATKQNLQLTYIIPFFVAMAFAGRGGALWWRARRGETELQTPASILFGIALLALTATIAAFSAR